MPDDPRHPLIPNQYVEITYVTIEGAGGSTRRWLTEIPSWLAGNPGFLIVKLRVLS